LLKGKRIDNILKSFDEYFTQRLLYWFVRYHRQ
jgi:hypothetical protein